ncbi:four helix bundle protein [Lutibacter sp. B1]|uniref:four helix bundle protein n=1 Tax=Lutibacter sp. B1 TaxID=2725996 RepID=UPI0014566245|nr:four helix bundle protein [Lutibacter sp. B1]NLP58468.1 four helix bundle protein [Lutibacter sp. B1]
MSFKKLLAYQKAFELSMEVFELTKLFPKEETYSLTNQIRRSSRAICANIAEAYRKRQYIKHFISKLTDADSENSETQVWIDFSKSCSYITNEQQQYLTTKSIKVGKLINFMIRNPEKFGVT